MKTIVGTNVNEVYSLGVQLIEQYGKEQLSQHGVTLEIPEPVSVLYLNPRERVLFDDVRDANPFLHLFESLWIIAGRKDVAFLEYLVPNMAKYSDDGQEYYGAYGHRMRNAEFVNSFGTADTGDQIKEAIARLKNSRDDRQVALTIRQPGDMWYKGKDNPCNLVVTVKIREGKLNMHVFNRSNDFIWGMVGTNVVQFSMLQEYMAGMIGVPVGMYHQTTDCMHVYRNEQWEKIRSNYNGGLFTCEYREGVVKPYDMMKDSESWGYDLLKFFDLFDIRGYWDGGCGTQFFYDIVWPMWGSFMAYKKWKDEKTPENEKAMFVPLAGVIRYDWIYAAISWLNKRVKNSEKS